MGLTLSRSIIVAALVMAGPSAVRAEVEQFGALRLDYDDEALRPSTPAQRKFVDAYRSAARNGAAGDFRALVHSAARACPDTPEQRMLEGYSRRSSRGEIPEGAKIIFLPADPSAITMFSMPDMMKSPVEATQLMAVTYKRTAPASENTPMRLIHQSIIEQLADDGGELRLVVACLTAKGVAQVRRKLDAQAAGSKPAP